jgi:hypothetical protein
MDQSRAVILPERIERAIVLVRGQKVMLDKDLAALYGVDTGNLNRAVRRNLDRFPEDFMFRLSAEEFDSLSFHFGISNRRGGRRYRPYAFTEQGVAMLSSILRSKRAARANIEIMRAFVRMRQLLSSNAELTRKLEALEKKYDSQFKGIRRHPWSNGSAAGGRTRKVRLRPEQAGMSNSSAAADSTR